MIALGLLLFTPASSFTAALHINILNNRYLIGFPPLIAASRIIFSGTFVNNTNFLVIICLVKKLLS